MARLGVKRALRPRAHARALFRIRARVFSRAGMTGNNNLVRCRARGAGLQSADAVGERALTLLLGIGRSRAGLIL